MKELGLDPKHYKYHSSDEKSTVLKHKNGHEIRIAHNAVAPKTRAMLQALSKIPQQDETQTQKQESDSPYGKIIQKADGGPVEQVGWDQARAPRYTAGNAPLHNQTIQDKTTPEQDKARQKQNDAEDAAFRHINPSQDSTPEPDDSGYTTYAKGGSVQQCAPSTMSGETPFAKGGEIEEGMSEQGKEVRYANRLKSAGPSFDKANRDSISHAKNEAKGRAEFEREHIRPKMKGLAEGGHVCPTCQQPKKMAKGGSVSPFDYNHERDIAEAPYNAGLPCLNPHCKSHGKPHPNCRCYSGGESYAEGGEVENYCSQNKPHQKYCEYFADGGEAGNVPDSLKDNASYDQTQSQQTPMTPVNLTINTGSAGQQPQVQTPQPPDQGLAKPIPKPAEPQQPQMAKPATMPQAPQQSMQQPMPPTTAQLPQQQTPYQQAYSDYKQKHQQELAEQDAAFEHDLVNGHVTPETYGSLFAKKDTIGKIGTIFGMLLGGAGSGLTGGPNPVLEMMNKQIQNDLDAQKTSKSDAQNFLRINQQDLINKAQAKNLAVDTQAKAYALSQAQMMQSSFHSLVKQVNSMPDGPEKQKAQQTLGMMYSKMGEKINNINDQASGAAAFSNMMFGNGQSQGQNGQTGAMNESDQDFQRRQSGLMALGPQGQDRAQFEQERHIPGVPGQASRAIPEDIRGQIQAQNVLDNKVNDVLNFAQKNRGSVNPQTLAQARQKAEELTSFYNKSVDSLGMTQGRLGWLEEQIKKNPTSLIQQLLGNNAVLREIRDSNVKRRDMALKSLGFPEQNTSKQEAAPIGGIQEGATGTYQGMPVIRRNGKWVPQ